MARVSWRCRLLGPLTALLPIVGFTNAAVVPISFLLSSTVRIVAISLVAAFGAYDHQP